MASPLLLAVLLATTACARRPELPRREMPQDGVARPQAEPRGAVPPMSRPRANAAAFRLDDGRVLVSGGQAGYGNGITATTEFFDPEKESWTAGPPMRVPRYNHRVIRLKDGRFLAVAGRGDGLRDLTECELYDPRTRTWELTGSLSQGRSAFGIALLPDGLVMVAGGFQTDKTLDSVEIYDPRAGAWSPGPPMREARHDMDFLTALEDGRVLAAGGYQVVDRVLRSAELYEPARGRWVPAGAMSEPRGQAVFFPLAGGRVLAAAGVSRNDASVPAASDLFDPASGRWTPADAPLPGMWPSKAWFEGRPALLGGFRNGALNRVEAFDAASGRWEILPPLKAPRLYAVSVPLKDGRWLVAGGEVGPRAIASAEIRRADGRPDREEFDPGTSQPAAQAATPSRQAAPRPRAPSSPVVPRRAERPDDYAVVVGVERYKSLPAASYAAGDARAMAEAVRALGVPEENVVLLEGSRAGLAELSKYIEEWLPRRVRKESRVYVYFSGHGAPDVEGAAPYLMPWDGDAAFVRSTGFSLERLYASLEKLPAREVVVALDSCFSGSGGRSVLSPGLRPLVNLRMPPARRRVSVLTASEAGEAAGGLPERGHGAFTYRLLEGLGGAADKDGDGRLTLGELHAYARKRVILDARAQGREQTPTLSSPEPGLRLY